MPANCSDHETLDDTEGDRFVWMLLGRIPIEYRVPLILVHGHRESVDLVAQILGLSTRTVKRRLGRGERLLQAQLVSSIKESTGRLGRCERVVAKVMAGLQQWPGAQRAPD